MSTFKPKRVSGSDLAAQLSGATAHLPAVTPRSEPLPQPYARERPPPVIQINFKATEALADLIAAEGLKAGSTRRFFARLMRDAGYQVPEADVSPPDNRRRRESMREGG